MSLYVIDTNVILAANRSHDELSLDCVEACVSLLEDIKQSGTVVVDDAYRIFKEYQNKTSAGQPKGLGDVFLKWLFQNSANPKRCVQIVLTEHAADVFDEFPAKDLERRFDPPDRKFVAVANAHPKKPHIVQAADCKWLDWNCKLKAYGIVVDFLCPDDICRFYQQKFPGKAVPDIQ